MMTDDEFTRMNERRHALISLKFGRGLTAAELVEYLKINTAMEEYCQQRWPLNFPDEVS